MTEPTTTELLASVRGYIIDEDQVGTSAALVELERAMMRGSPLPAQWPHAKELEELRAKVAKYEAALRTISGIPEEYASEEVFTIAEEALKP